MSEDADIKVVLSADTANWSKTRLRRYLGDELRGQVIKAMEAAGFVETVDSRRSLNDNQYLHSQWAYQRAYGGITALRPHLQLELFARTPVLPTAIASIGALADKLAGLVGSPFSVPVVSVAETLAEKVLSFLRRFAQHRSGQMQQDWDRALVRHIYDAHCIVSQKPQALAASVAAFAAITSGDVQEFGYQDTAFAMNPGVVLEGALRQMEDDAQSREAYNLVLLPLVYGEKKYAFDEAFGSFRDVARQMLGALQ